jgi:hypothetical protein
MSVTDPGYSNVTEWADSDYQLLIGRPRVVGTVRHL